MDSSIEVPLEVEGPYVKTKAQMKEIEKVKQTKYKMDNMENGQ